ncbi:oligosaccharide flippase family protein [Halorientalis salina]|uniref:oligosaccharide flippase family protein n=1 Tax=Halorientalis salina TaxID=2932266 RepID=UPI0010AD9012|nr:polysaccharide biosynthesis C-terminal domain-containing protein [Halorientalis salina]
MQRNIVSGVLSVVSGKVVTMVIGIMTTPILYRLLGPGQFGEYTTVLSVHAILMIFVSSGITDGVRKFVAEDRAGTPGWKPNVVGFYFRIAVALALLGVVGYIAAIQLGLVDWLFGPKFETYFSLMIVMVVAAQVWAYARKTLMGFGLERYSEPLKVLYRLVFATSALALVYVGYGVIGALAGQVLGTLLVGIIGLVLVTRQIPVRALFQSAPAAFPRKQMVTYNVMAVALSLFLLSLYHVDIIMLQTLAGSTQVGNYKAALVLAEFLWFVPITLQTVYVHSTSELWSQGRFDRIADLAARTTRYTLLLTALMALGLGSLANIVVPIYWGDAALPAISPLLLLLPGAIGFATVRPTLAIQQGHGQLRYPVLATAAAALLNLGCNFLLIPRYGMSGAAVATSIGYGSMLFFHVWSARKLGFDPIGDARLLRIGATVAIAAVPIVLLSRLLPGSIAPLLIVPPVGLVVYLTAAFLTGALTVQECLDLLAAFPDPIGSFVDRFDTRRRTRSMATLLPERNQLWLLVIGLLLFAAGTAVAAFDTML